jgi:periplasmic divalent cation tolerance protein
MTATQIVLTTCPDESVAQQIASTLVSEKLAACVNIIPGLTSVYEWQGNIEQDNELLLLIKTRQALSDQLFDRIQALHPYELPEIITVPIEGGLPAYLDWILKTTGKS